MFTHPKSPLAGRALLAGLVMLGLAACQPAAQAEVPGSGGSGGAGGAVVTTTTAAPAVTTTTAAPITPTTTTTTAVPSGLAGWKLVGGDEFNDTALDGSRWQPYHSNYGSSNLELECNTPNNVSESAGSLRIVAKKQAVTCPSGGAMNYTSGFVGSRETGTYYPRYARFEMRAKLPHAQGLWPAFWLRHHNGAGTAEVDIMEYFHSQVPGKTTQTLHLDGVSNVSKKTTAFENPANKPGFHTWAVEITPDPAGVRFTFYVDDVQVHTYVDAKHAWTSSADAASTWDIALNLAVGGRWVGSPDGTLGYLDQLNRCSIAGTAPGSCSTSGINRVDWSDPADETYQIDYVRVYTPA
ncbi:glycoside hydrolase family 16 protein [Aquihabitans sp. McL0605]|uniref:glycoside hydrolase family 16 protein n=1 Tax=Aquihabitans sp. McL0605 TaxID=3415671 RepID=UPI003CF6054A